MKKRVKPHLWFCLPLLIAYAADVTSTVLGQSAQYWSGAYWDVNEANPVSYWFLSAHPLAYIAYRIVVFIMLGMVIVLCPTLLAKLISTAFFLAHTVGAESWMRDVYHFGYWERGLCVFLLSVIFTLAFVQAEARLQKLRSPATGG